MDKKTKNIRAVAFDMGGVVLPISRENAVNHFAEIGLPDADAFLDAYHQVGLMGDLEEGKIDEEKFRQEVSALVGREVTWGECQYGCAGYFSVFPANYPAALTKLRSMGYRTLLLSNTNPFAWAWVAGSKVEGMTEPGGLAPYFDNIYLSYECHCMKPSAEIFNILLEREQLKAGEVLFLDDSPANTEAAAQLGLHTLCTPNGADWTEAVFNYLQDASFS